MSRARLLLALAAGISFAAGGQAWAQDAGGLRAAVFAHPDTHGRAIAPVVPLADARPGRPDGVAKTSVDHAFARTGLTGSLGFLCGLDGRLDAQGGMGAFGRDPQGRFIGAKLHMRFR